MRIIEINATYNIGSTGRIVYEIGEALEKNGVKCFYACQSSTIKKDNIYIVGNKIDWKLHALGSRIGGMQGFYSKKATKKLLAFIDRNNIDVAHLHNLHSNFINLPMLIDHLNKRRIPIVITLHDCWFFTGKCFHYIDVGCDRFTFNCGKCPKLHMSPISYFFDKTNKMLTIKKRIFKESNLTIVGCSDWICSETKKSFLKEKRIVAIHNGVDTNVFKAKEFNQGNNNQSIKILGIANKWRLECNKSFVEKISSIDHVSIEIIGANSKDIKYFKSINKNISVICGQKTQEEMSECFANSDVFVNLSRSDTLPTVIMESICCGCPVIAFNSGGSVELVSKECGFIVDSSKPDELVEALQNIKSISRKRCSEYGLTYFDKRDFVKKYVELIKNIGGTSE